MSPNPSPARNRLAPASGRTSRPGLVGSALLHGGIIAATFFTWAHTLDIADQSPPVVPVDLVTIGDKTNIAPMMQKQEQIEAKDNIQPPQPDVTKVPTVQQQAEAAPPPLQATSEPKIAAPQPVALPKSKPQADEKKDKFDINNIVALLDKRAPAATSPRNAKLGNRSIQGVGAQNAMTMDLVDALRNQISQCWSPPVGAPHPDQLIVSFELFLNPDGSVAQPPQLTANSSGTGDPFLRAAAEAARRAIYTCAPYKLPADRYGQWRDITLVFDPRQMVGQ